MIKFNSSSQKYCLGTLHKIINLLALPQAGLKTFVKI